MAAKTLGGRRLPRFSPNEAFRTVERLLFFPRGGDGGDKLYFELEKRPAGAFRADKIVLSQKVIPQGPFGQNPPTFGPAC